MSARQLQVYGLKNCDGCRRALRWLDARGADYDFLDIREAGNTAAVVKHIAQSDDWQPFVNRRSTTWRQLPASAKDKLDMEKSLALLRKHPTLIKRPVIVAGKSVHAGFDQATVETLLN